MQINKYFSKYQTEEDYNNNKDTHSKPHVSYIVNPNKYMIYIQKPSYINQYFTIEALEDGLTVKLSTNACEYRIDDGDWISLAAYTATAAINSGQKISFKITNPIISYGIGTFNVNKEFNVEGNIMSLLYGDDFIGQKDLSGKNFVFCCLFENCTTLQNAKNLILPATTLANDCYNSMFNYCIGLISAPELPATTLAKYCYQYMFSGCSKLNYIKMLATDISASNCLGDWVNGVARSGTFIKHPDMASLPSGKDGIPTGWTVKNYNESNLITFTIDGIEYQAEEGMTWEEWINSQYNINNFIFYGDVIKNNGYQCDGLYVYTAGRHIYVKRTDYIDEKNTYKFFFGGSGD